jgi:hypothetical protein
MDLVEEAAARVHERLSAVASDALVVPSRPNAPRRAATAAR